MLQHSLLDEDELSRERAVVLQELGQAEDTPDDIIFDHFQSCAFPAQALGRPVLGHPDIIGSLPRDALVDYIGSNYSGRTMVLAASGRIDHDPIVEMAERTFRDLPAPTDPAPLDPARYTGGDFREDRDLEQLHIVLGFEGVGSTIPTTTPTPSSRPCSAAACRPACSRKYARSAGWPTASTPSPAPMRTTGCSASMPVPARKRSANWSRSCATSCARSPTTSPTRKSAAPAPSSRPAC